MTRARINQRPNRILEWVAEATRTVAVTAVQWRMSSSGCEKSKQLSSKTQRHSTKTQLEVNVDGERLSFIHLAPLILLYYVASTAALKTPKGAWPRARMSIAFGFGPRIHHDSS